MTEQQAPDRGPSRADFTYLDTTEALAAYLAEAKEAGHSACAIDTEADSLHSYEEKLCLIQFAAGGRYSLIDPLAIDDLSPLVRYLDSVDVWLHGADFDMRMLRRTFDWIPGRVYDTQTAARLLGARRFGLANLVESHKDIVLPKGSQKADWGKRPLPDKMLQYAVNDVRYLLSIADALVADLREKGRWDWFIESCDTARDSAMVRREKDLDKVWRITGWGKLEPRGLAFLRALWWWRDGEAERRDRPSFKIINNEYLVDYARALQGGGNARLPQRFNGGAVRRFNEAVEKAEALPRSEWPEGPKRKRVKREPRFDARFGKLRSVRDANADRLGLDPTLIASRGTLETISGNPEVLASGEVQLMRWQRALLEPAIDEVVAEIE